MSAAIQVLMLDVGGTITYEVVEGTPTPASVTVYDENGASIETPSVTISGTTLSATVAAGTVDAVADTYRARWQYTVSGVVYRRDQVFRVRASVAAHQLSATRLVTEYYPILTARYPRGVSAFTTLINAAFVELAAVLRAKGLDIDRMLSFAPAEPALAALAAHRIAVNYGFGNDATSAHQQWAADRYAEYVTRLDRAIASWPWYDAGDDLLPGTGEVNAPIGILRLRR